MKRFFYTLTQNNPNSIGLYLIAIIFIIGGFTHDDPLFWVVAGVVLSVFWVSNFFTYKK